MKKGDRWSVYTYNQESGTVKERRTCRLLKDAETVAEMYLKCRDVDAVLVFDNYRRHDKRTFGYFPMKQIMKLMEARET